MATRKPSSLPMSADEKKWRARADADTLAAAEAIKRDRSRMTAAQKSACEEAKRYEAVAKGKSEMPKRGDRTETNRRTAKDRK